MIDDVKLMVFLIVVGSVGIGILLYIFTPNKTISIDILFFNVFGTFPEIDGAKVQVTKTIANTIVEFDYWTRDFDDDDLVQSNHLSCWRNFMYVQRQLAMIYNIYDEILINEQVQEIHDRHKQTAAKKIYL